MIFDAAIPVPSAGLRYAAAPDGSIYSLLGNAPRLCKGTLCKDGYIRVQIQFEDGTKKMMAAHRLVAEVHCPNPDGHPEVNHIDGIKTSNAAANLEWCNRRHNIRHAFATGLNRGAPRHSLANPASVGALRSQGFTLQRIAHELGCGVATAHKYEKEAA